MDVSIKAFYIGPIGGVCRVARVPPAVSVAAQQWCVYNINGPHDRKCSNATAMAAGVL